MIQTINDAKVQKQFDESVGKYITLEFKDWLIKNGFFIKPATINHHGNFIGGLFKHSFSVMKQCYGHILLICMHLK